MATVTFFHADSTTTVVSVAQTTVYPGFNGSLAAGGDLAVLTLSSPVTDVRGFELYRGSNEIGSTFNVSGFGQPGTGGTGQTGALGQIRYGLNQFESVIGGAPLTSSQVGLREHRLGLRCWRRNGGPRRLRQILRTAWAWARRLR